MKKGALLLLLIFLTTAQNVLKAQEQELMVSDTEDSGCLREARGQKDVPVPTIILTKEGSILSVQILNYESNCAIAGFIVKSNMIEGKDGAPCSLNINVTPDIGDVVADCICPYNVSFTVHDLDANSFYLSCWWYQGLVSLTEGESLVLEDVWENIAVDDTKYTLRKALGRAMLTDGNTLKGEYRIPSELSYEGQTYSVTSFSRDAFSSNTNLTKLIIPSSIINMDLSNHVGFTSNPFYYTSLESIEVEEGNPAICSVDGVLFNKEKTKLLSYPPYARRTSYTVPEGVTWVEACAFFNNRYLKNITLSDEVTALGYSAFCGSKHLEEVRLPSGLKVLGDWMFANCPQLKSVSIPEGVTYFASRVFSGCTNLISVTMPESVTSTDVNIFENCESLESVTLSPNLGRIMYGTFTNCKSLKEISIPNSVTDIGSEAFMNCSALETLDLPESVTRLGTKSFAGCKLNSLYIRGIIAPQWISSNIFMGMGTQTKVYVQPSEVGKFQAVYRGKVYPIPDQTGGIVDTVFFGTTPHTLYDLQGRRVADGSEFQGYSFRLPKGIYIQGGKKVVIK